MNRNDFRRLSEIRKRDASALLSNRQYSGAYYLVGYAAECALKACIAKSVRRYDFPDRQRVINSYTHDLNKLVGVAGLQALLEVKAANDPEFRDNWSVAKDWNEERRYERISRRRALDLCDAIMDDEHGVLVWLQQYW